MKAASPPAQNSQTGRVNQRSFRDPDGFLFEEEGRILRALTGDGAAKLDALLQTPFVLRRISDGTLIGASNRSNDLARLAGLLNAACVVEHERIPFPSYPHEWPPAMLHAAAQLTLEMAAEALEDGYGVKDASPWNVLFRGPKPVFVDLPSLERRAPGDPLWLAEGQFQRTFLLPLMAMRHLRMQPAEIFLSRADGLEPEELYRRLGVVDRLRPRWWANVCLPVWLGGSVKPTHYRRREDSNHERARFVLRSRLRLLGSTLRKLAPEFQQSNWSSYSERQPSYTGPQLEAKREFTAEALERLRPAWVLDAGANTGQYSRQAAMAGSRVVAADSDLASVGKLHAMARREDLDILPLVVDVAIPTPSTGWRNRECLSFLDRASGRFDLVLGLALVHHLAITRRVPVAELIDFFAQLTRSHALVEFIDPPDPMFQALVRGRDTLYEHLDHTVFEALAARRFVIEKSLRLPGSHRYLYLLRKPENA